MDENKSPQDILNEIFEKSQAAATPLPQPRFEPPGDDPPPAPPPGEPTEKRGTEAGAKLLPWLCVMLGAALLVLGVCLLQLVRMGRRLDGLQEAVEAVRSVNSLREENKQLQEQLDQAGEEILRRIVASEDAGTRSAKTLLQKRQLDYLWYISQFLEHGDYPMAALVVTLSAQKYFDNSYADVPADRLNPEQTAQYRAYTQELIDRGYLGEVIDPAHVPLNSQLPPTQVGFAAQWDPEQNPDMAALGILWCALDEYYVTGVPYPAAQWLVDYQNHPLYDDTLLYENRDLLLSELKTTLSQRIDRAATDYTVLLYERLIHDLTEEGYLAEQDGALKIGTSDDIYYLLPFSLPGHLHIEISGN